jgi:hypothetical protein
MKYSCSYCYVYEMRMLILKFDTTLLSHVLSWYHCFCYCLNYLIFNLTTYNIRWLCGLYLIELPAIVYIHLYVIWVYGGNLEYTSDSWQGTEIFHTVFDAIFKVTKVHISVCIDLKLTHPIIYILFRRA